MAGVLLVAGVVTIAIVLATTTDSKKNNRSDTPGVAGAYAAAFAASPPLTVATYNDCAQLLAARESSGPCPARGGADNAPRRIKELRGGRCRSRDGWLRGGPVFATAEDAGAEDTPTSEDFSGTNVQEEGVDEADTVKTSGDFIYKVGEIRGGEREADGSLEDCAYRLSVVEDTVDGLRLVASVDLEPLDTTPEAMFVHGNVLLLYGSAEVVYDDTAEKNDDYDYCTKGEPATVVLTFDVTDPTSPILLRRQIIEGSYVSARNVDAYAYLVLAKRTYWADPRSSVPFYQRENSTTMEPAVACDDVVFLNTVSDDLDDFTVVAAIDMDDVDAATTFTVIAGKAADGAVYASRSNIYLVLAEWTYYRSASYTRSVFLKLRLSGPEVAFDTMMWAPGQLLNQYAMSEAQDGSFRAATTSRAVSGWWFDTSNNLYVFDAAGNEVGAVEGLAPGETIKAVRFTTDRCYLVTFVQTDPLFSVHKSNCDGARFDGVAVWPHPTH